MTICVQRHNSRESTLNAVSRIATDCSGTKAERATKLCNNAYKSKRGTDLSDLQQCVQRQKGSTDLSDLSLNRWLDEQQDANRVSCQVTVVVVVTDIDVSSTTVTSSRKTILGKGGGAKKRFKKCFNPNSSYQLLYLRAIQGHLVDNAVDPTLQGNVLLPKGFTEYIYMSGTRMN